MEILYRVTTNEDGTPEVEEVEVLKEDILPGASVPSIEVRYRKGGRKTRCSRAMFSPTLKEALQGEIDDCHAALQYLDEEEVRIKESRVLCQTALTNLCQALLRVRVGGKV